VPFNAIIYATASTHDKQSQDLKKNKNNEIFAEELEISEFGYTLLTLNIQCFCSTSLKDRPWMKQTSDHSILISQHEHAR